MNKIQNIGDSLIVTIRPRQNGTTILKSFTDNLTGISERRFVYREFRIIEDDLFYSDWKELNEESLENKKLKQNAKIEVRYTRQGVDTTGEIEFKSIEFDGEFKEEKWNSPVLERSMFSGVAWSEETEQLAINLFKKMYFRGIIPNYVLRGDNIDVEEDEDYITLFYSIARFFAIIFKFFKRFENFYDDYELMLEWLRQNNVQIDESSITLEEMKYLTNHLYDEIRKRGTIQIFHRKDDAAKKVDGELIRLIRNKKEDELIYEYMSLSSVGWCVGQSSPLYRGTCFSTNLNKTRENSKDFISLDNYNTFFSEKSSVNIQHIEDKQILSLETNGENESCGLGRLDAIENPDKLYVAETSLDYEITFMFKITEGVFDFNFGVESFDVHKRKFYDATITTNDNETTEWFFSELSSDNFIKNKWYFVRGIIHAYGSDLTENTKLNIGFGNNLKFNNRFTKYILPKIFITSKTSKCNVCLWDYKIRPLVRGTNILPLKSGYEKSHSMGFIQSPRILYLYAKNNNNSQSESEIATIIDKYLLPFNMSNILLFF